MNHAFLDEPVHFGILVRSNDDDLSDIAAVDDNLGRTDRRLRVDAENRVDVGVLGEHARAGVLAAEDALFFTHRGDEDSARAVLQRLLHAPIERFFVERIAQGSIRRKDDTDPRRGAEQAQHERARLLTLTDGIAGHARTSPGLGRIHRERHKRNMRTVRFLRESRYIHSFGLKEKNTVGLAAQRDLKPSRHFFRRAATLADRRRWIIKNLQCRILLLRFPAQALDEVRIKRIRRVRQNRDDVESGCPHRGGIAQNCRCKRIAASADK